MQLASKFRSFTSTRSAYPLSDEEIVRVAPSIFAEGKHQSRSQRYAYIPTSDVLKGLRNEGFQPFMVCQTRVRDESRHEYTKHMIRLRHATQITGREANEIILLNSHDGTVRTRCLQACTVLFARMAWCAENPERYPHPP